MNLITSRTLSINFDVSWVEVEGLQENKISIVVLIFQGEYALFSSSGLTILYILLYYEIIALVGGYSGMFQIHN
jgi:hypothetical protein